MSRIEVFKQMLEADPANSTVLFGLAKEYEKAGLTRYLATSNDEGNAYGMLASAYEKIGDRVKAREVYQQGIEAALAHGHPSMAEEYRMTLASEYGSE